MSETTEGTQGDAEAALRRALDYCCRAATAEVVQVALQVYDWTGAEVRMDVTVEVKP